MKDINEGSIEHAINEIKKHLDQGWSLSMSKKKAGLLLPRGQWILQTKEYKELASWWKRGYHNSKRLYS